MPHASVFEAGRRDPLRQSLGQIDVAGGHKSANLVRHGFVIDGVLKPIVPCVDLPGERNVDAHRLQLALLVAMHADSRQELEVANKDDHFPAVHSITPVTSGVRQARCWPPSTAIIWPVTARASSRYWVAAATSSGEAPRPKIVDACWRLKWASL